MRVKKILDLTRNRFHFGPAMPIWGERAFPGMVAWEGSLGSRNIMVLNGLHVVWED